MLPSLALSWDIPIDASNNGIEVFMTDVRSIRAIMAKESRNYEVPGIVSCIDARQGMVGSV